MGIEVLPVESTQAPANGRPETQTGDDTGALIKQSEIQPSEHACTNLLDELSADMPSGKPLLNSVNPDANPDLSAYGFKQANELLSPGGTGKDDITPIDSMHVGDMRPGLYGQRSERPSQISSPDESAISTRPEYFKDMQDVFGKSRYFDLVRNHNAVISTPEGQKHGDHIHAADESAVEDLTASVSQNPSEKTTLINFDAHSDLWVNDAQNVVPGRESIAQWVNAVLKENPNIDEVFWVLPDSFKSNPELSKHYFDHKGEMPAHDTVLVHSKPDLDLYVNKATGAITTGEKPEDYSEETHRLVKFHKRTIDELPNMADKRVAASIDLDYFDNRGYDTTYDGQAEYQGDKGFEKFVKTLKEKDIRPVHTTVSASPEYVRSEHIRDLLKFSSNVADATASKMDAVAVPRQDTVYEWQKHSGIQVDRGDSKGLTLFYDMFKHDSLTARPDDALDIGKESQELKQGIESTKRIYGVDETQAREILAKFDAMDGKKDNILQFESIEMLLNRVCKTNPADRLRKDPSARRSG